MPQRPAPEWNGIREVFLSGRTSWETVELPALLGIDESTVRQALDDGTLTAAGFRVSWEELVAWALQTRWTYRMLTAALQGRDRGRLPPLVRVTRGRIALPRYQWALLRLLAAEKGRAERRELTVSDLLEEAVTTAFVMKIDDWERVERLLPGIRAADAWPCTIAP